MIKGYSEFADTPQLLIDECDALIDDRKLATEEDDEDGD